MANGRLSKYFVQKKSGLKLKDFEGIYAIAYRKQQHFPG